MMYFALRRHEAANMLKPPDALLEPDVCFLNMAGGIGADGSIRRMAIDDLYEQMQSLVLSPEVPDVFREQFDKARHTYIYSWLGYDLVSLAEQRGYRAQ